MHLEKYYRNKYIFGILLLLLMLILPQWVVAQISLPACTASIEDTDGDSITDDDGAGGRIDIDKDGDGLIEICDLEGINEIRYQLDGSGYTTSTDAVKITQGCPTSGCVGYELFNSLDFNVDASYRSASSNKDAWTNPSAAGWQPIGYSSNNRFSGVFEGNGHTIANLHIRRELGKLGLYSNVGKDGKIINVQLLDVDVDAEIGSASRIGALTGENRGAIINSYATGAVAGINHIGGLVGYNFGSVINSYATVNVSGNENVGGLIGWGSGPITNSYATGIVSGSKNVGGLIGQNRGIIINSYATGMVSGSENVGGLIGFNGNGSIINSYATGMASGNSNVGGLVGSEDGSSVESYWDTSKTKVMISAGGMAKTTVELQSPIASTGIYSDWSSNDWDFGASDHYPLLRYAQGGNLDACSNDITPSSTLPPCGVLLPNQSGRDRNKGLSGVFFLEGDRVAPVELTPLFSQVTYHYDMTIVALNLDIQLRPYAVNDNAKIAIHEGDTNYFSGDRPDGLSDMIELDDNETQITIVVTDIINAIPTNTTYTFVIVRLLPIRVDINRSRLTFIIEEATADPDGAGNFSYQWQQQVLGLGWTDIAGATKPTYNLPANADGSIRYRLVNIKHIDGGDNITNYPNEGPFRISADDDGDGLIDIYILEDLDTMRYQLDGRGYRRNKDAKRIVQGCPGQVCSGYELRRDLDFNADTSYGSISNKVIWATAPGWDPIGREDNRFSSIFEGNGHIISGLNIDRAGFPIGLFSALSANSEIKNVGLLDVDVSGSTQVGALIGWNDGSIINSYAFGTVAGVNTCGGLVGGTQLMSQIISSFANISVKITNQTAGGLIGVSRGLIINSYAVGEVNSGDNIAGGLVGDNHGSIINSYATGNVVAQGSWSGGLVGGNYGSIKNTYARGAVSSSHRVGGLVGLNLRGSSIAYSYATGTVAGDDYVGGLVGANNGGDVTTSYWDVNASMQQMDAGGSPKTTVELQLPTAAGTTTTDVYYGWNESDWDFGHSNRYPVLNYVSGDVNACNSNAETVSLLPTCGTPLSQQRRGLDRVLLFVDDVDLTEMLTPSFSPVMFSYEAALATAAKAIRVTLQPLASNADATIKITKQGDTTTDYFAGKSNDTLSDSIISSHSITLEVVVTDTLYGDITTDTIYTVEIAIPFTVTELTTSLGAIAHSDGTIDEGITAMITFAVSGGSGNYRYQYKLIDGASERELSQLPPPVGLSMPADLVAAKSISQTVKLNILVSDDDGHSFEHSEEITVRKVDNGVATVDVIRATSRTLTVKVGSDPDGDASKPGYEYQWQWREPEAGSSWQDIMSATDESYAISDDLASVRGEFRIQVTYTDGQGYKKTLTSNVIKYIPGIKIRTKVFLEGPLR